MVPWYTIYIYLEGTYTPSILPSVEGTWYMCSTYIVHTLYMWYTCHVHKY